MVQPSQQFASVKTETEVAVLQVQYDNLNEKVEEVKEELKGMRTLINEESKKTRDLITEFQTDNTKTHKEMSDKISSLEKWRWMIMGAGIALGVAGFEMAAKLLGIGA